MDRIIDSRISFIKIVLITLSMLGMLIACSRPKPFELFDDTVQIKKGTLAVISADASEPAMMLAQYLTDELKRRSTFRVMSQEEIGRRIVKYPVTIKWENTEEDKPVWLAKGEKNKLNAIQAQLKADYLFVVWTTYLNKTVVRSQSGGGKIYYSVGILGNLFEYPKNRAVGYSNVSYSRDQSCCLFGKSEGDDINAMLKESAHNMADKLLASTKAEKPEK
jgi:hypothetical protein